MQNFSRYLTASQFDEDWGLFVTTAGYTRINTHQNYPPDNGHPESHSFNWNSGRILDGYYLVFISNGAGLFESAACKGHQVKAGDCFLLFPGEWHRYKPDLKSGWEEYWVGFKGNYADTLMMKNFSAGEPFVTTGLNNHILRLFHELIEYIQQASAGYHQIIAGMTLQLLGHVLATFRNQHNNGTETEKIIEKAKFLLRESLQEPDKLEHIMQQLPVSYSKFRKDFKKLTGQSPNQYQLNLRLDKARELLATTHLSISEIAWQTGFGSVFYLSKMFSKKNDISPMAYRTVHLNPKL